MRSRLLISIVALALTGAVASCEDVTSIEENFQEDATWVADLNGATEVPAVNTPATGRAWFIDRGDVIDYRMEYSGLTSNAGNAHIHRGAAGVGSGAVMVQLSFVTAQSGVVIGSIDMARADVSSEAGTQTAAELRTLMNSGGVYVNVHSTQFPGGEIRGQIMPR